MDGGCRVDRPEVYVSEHWVSYALTASRLSYWTKLLAKLLASSGLTTGLEPLVDITLITLIAPCQPGNHTAIVRHGTARQDRPPAGLRPISGGPRGCSRLNLPPPCGSRRCSIFSGVLTRTKKNAWLLQWAIVRRPHGAAVVPVACLAGAPAGWVYN